MNWNKIIQISINELKLTFFLIYIQNLKSIIKEHEHDLSKLKATYDELKQMIERVRSCKYDGESNNGIVVPFNGSSSNSNGASNGGVDSMHQPGEDFVKLDHLMDQLTDRWNTAVNLYTQRYIFYKTLEFSYKHLIDIIIPFE